MMTASQANILTAAALRAFGLMGATTTRLGGTSNLNLRVDAGGQAFHLRMHTIAERTQAELASELAWLRSLHDHTPLVLPLPLPTPDANLVVTVSDGTTTAHCTLFTWLPGHIPPTAAVLSDQQLFAVGALMAKLHQHAQVAGPPPAFTRPAYASNYFRRQRERLITTLRLSSLAPLDVDRLASAADATIVRLTAIEPNHSNFGVIHADFHSGNYLLDGDTVTIIDFDRCGWGFFLHDLALALMELEVAQRPPLLSGYASVAPLPAGYSEQIKVFLGLAFLDNLSYLSANPDELPFILAELSLLMEALQC